MELMTFKGKQEKILKIAISNANLRLSYRFCCNARKISLFLAINLKEINSCSNNHWMFNRNLKLIKNFTHWIIHKKLTNNIYSKIIQHPHSKQMTKIVFIK